MRVCSETALRLLFAVVMLSLLGGCSSVRLLYSNLDRAIVWRTGDWVDLDRDQRRWLREEVRAHLEWHRAEHLPQWSRLLHDLDVAAADGVDIEGIRALEDRALTLVDETSRRLLPTVVDLLADLDDTQIEGLAAAFETSNAELNEDYEGLDPDAQRAVWRDKTRDGLERWVGRLQPAQEALLESLSMEVEPDNSAWVAYRERWQRDLLAALGQRDQADAFEERIAELVLHRERWYTQDYRQQLEQNQDAYRRFAVALLASLDDRQRERLSRRLTGLARDFDLLASRSG